MRWLLVEIRTPLDPVASERAERATALPVENSRGLNTVHVDDYGLTISTQSEIAAARYCGAVANVLAAWPGATDQLDAAIEADPGFALAYAARARLYAMRGASERARGEITLASAAAVSATWRERSQVEVVALALSGKAREAQAHALAHVEAWPRDVTVLSMLLGAFGLFAFSGMADHDQAKVDLCERVASHFSDDDWWFLTFRGWALAENSEVARGRAMLERALDHRRNNANVVHALAHAMFEAGAHGEAETLIDGWLPDYDRTGLLHGHIAWHAALSALERDDAEAALAIYDRHVQPAVSSAMPINVVSDGVSLLWRLDAYGYGAPADRWREIADYARPRFSKPGHAFIDAHMAIVEAATGETSDLDRRIARLEVLVQDDALGAGAVVPALARAAFAFRTGDFSECARLLSPLASDVVRIGGSGAQRALFEDMLLVALMGAGETEKAQSLLGLRLQRRPSTRDSGWLRSLAA